MYHASRKTEFATRVVRAVIALTAVIVSVATGVFAGVPQQFLTQQQQPQSKPEHAAANAGSRFVLGDLQIEGEVPDRDALRDRVLKQWQDVPYENEARLAALVVRMGVVGDLRDHGYLLAQADLKSTGSLGIVAGRERILVVAAAEAGEQYSVGGLAVRVVDKSLAVPPPEVVQQEFQLDRGELFNMTHLGRGLTQLREWYRAHGSPGVLLVPIFKTNDAQKLVDITIQAGEMPPPKPK